MIESNNPHEFQQATLSMQHQLRKDKSFEQESYICPHPKWFNVSEQLEVDETICRFCGYQSSCSKFKESSDEHVKVVVLDQSHNLSQTMIESCFIGFDKYGNSQKIDPFNGFSPQAGSTRELYLISKQNFVKFANNNSEYHKIESAVGYDAKYGQPIWVFDQIMLAELHSGDNLVKLEKMLVESTFDEIGNLFFSSDKKNLRKVAIKLNWCEANPPKSDFDEIFLFLNRLSHCIFETIPSLISIAKTPFLPHIDFPPNYGCSDIANLVIRFLHFHSDMIKKYCDSGKRFSDENSEIHIKAISKLISIPLFSYADISVDNKARRYLPRFPLIAFGPMTDTTDLNLEFAAGRIIEVIEFQCAETVLLIDGLGLDLEVHGPWSQC